MILALSQVGIYPFYTFLDHDWWRHVLVGVARMAVIPFPSSRFTKGDIGAIVDLCYRLTSVELAGGWARHTSDRGADIVCILNPHDDHPKYTFDRSSKGRYRLWGADGGVIMDAGTVDELLTALGARETGGGRISGAGIIL